MVSVIIPVYNAERSLRRCLDSFANQTYKDLDIIVVDDGSTDGSGAICDDYVAKDSRFRVIHQQNGGVSVARQTGIDAVRGEYFIFADADDWVDTLMIQELYFYAEESNADVVICDFYIETKMGWKYSSQFFPDNTTNNDLIKRILGSLHGSCCNKLIRTDCIKQITFSPSDLSFCEDELFIVRILNTNVKVIHYGKAFYYYCLTQNSLSHSCQLKMFTSLQKEIDELDKILDPDIKEECLFYKKQNALCIAFLSNTPSLLQLLNNTYLEVHERIIEEGLNYNYKLPLKSCLSIALRGYPKMSYCLYKINISLIHCFQMMKSFLHFRFGCVQQTYAV